MAGCGCIDGSGEVALRCSSIRKRKSCGSKARGKPAGIIAEWGELSAFSCFTLRTLLSRKALDQFSCRLLVDAKLTARFGCLVEQYLHGVLHVYFGRGEE